MRLLGASVLLVLVGLLLTLASLLAPAPLVALVGTGIAALGALLVVVPALFAGPKQPRAL